MPPVASPPAVASPSFLLPSAALLTLLALKLAVLVAFGPTTAPDSSDYIRYAGQILSGEFRHVDLAKDAIPLTLYRPIGYPAIIAAARTLAPVHWAWAVVLFQFAVSIWATAMVYRVARRFRLGQWASLGVAAAQATSLQFVLDQAILSDSLCAGTLTIAACIMGSIVLRREPPRLMVVVGAGALIAAAFLMRDVIALVALGLVPFAAMTAWSGNGGVRRLVAFALVFLPLIAAQLAYYQWNRARVGAAVVTTVAQWSLLDPLVRASRYDPTIFAGSGEIDRAARQVVKNFTLDESLEVDKILHRDDGWSAVRIAHEVTAAYLRAWIEHPRAMLRHALSFFSETQLHQAVRPTETVRDVLLWNTGDDHDFARERAVRDGNRWMIPAVVAHHLFETISILIFAAFVAVTPLRLLREGLTPETRASLGFWCSYLVCLGLHAGVSLHARYLSPVVAGSIIVGAANISWLVARYRGRSARDTRVGGLSRAP